MKGLLISILSTVLLAGVSLAQNQAQTSPGTVAHLAPGTIIRVELTKSIDAKKAKVGDEVMAKTMDDFLSDKNEVLAPKGSRVLAHVAEVSPHQGDSASTLGIAFDKMVLKNGMEMPLKVSIQAIGTPEANTGAAMNQPIGESSGGGMSPMPSSGRGGYQAPSPNLGGNTAGPGTAGTASPDSNSGTSNGQLTPKAQGVVGMSGVSLGAGTGQDSLLTSQKHNVKLDSGTQMILRVMP
jgi:hypothetical protein